MKKILLGIFIFISFNVYSQTRVTATIVPNNISDTTYPTHLDTLGKGGFMSFNSITERNALAFNKRKIGMLAYTISTAAMYQLQGTLANSGWTQIFFSTSSSASTTGSNGVTLVGNDLRLGGTLTTPTTIVTNDNALGFNNVGINSFQINGIQNSIKYALKLLDSANSAGGGLYVSSPSIGIDARTTNGKGIVARSTGDNGVPVELTVINSDGSTGNEALRIISNPTTLGTGSGSKINFLGSSIGAVANKLQSSIESQWSNADSATRTSVLNFYTTLNGVTTPKMSISGNGLVGLKGYGQGTFTGDVAYVLAEDASGNVIEMTYPPSIQVNTLQQAFDVGYGVTPQINGHLQSIVFDSLSNFNARAYNGRNVSEISVTPFYNQFYNNNDSAKTAIEGTIDNLTTTTLISRAEFMRSSNYYSQQLSISPQYIVFSGKTGTVGSPVPSSPKVIFQGIDTIATSPYLAVFKGDTLTKMPFSAVVSAVPSFQQVSVVGATTNQAILFQKTASFLDTIGNVLKATIITKNLSNNRTLILPNNDGYLPVSVNGNFADASGNITIAGNIDESNLVHRTNNETISGIKIFTDTTKGTMSALSDSSLNFVTSKWVKQQNYMIGGPFTQYSIPYAGGSNSLIEDPTGLSYNGFNLSVGHNDFNSTFGLLINGGRAALLASGTGAIFKTNGGTPADASKSIQFYNSDRRYLSLYMKSDSTLNMNTEVNILPVINEKYSIGTSLLRFKEFFARVINTDSLIYTDGNQGVGKVLTSDANGLATWQTPATGGGGGGTLNDVTATNNTGQTWTITGTTTKNLFLALTKAAVGLNNVDNTDDISKPISTLTQNALNLKADASTVTSALALKANLASPTFTGTVNGITKAMVGLGNVDNTTDLNKPISTATQTALNLKADATALALKANIASPTFTGTVSGITKAMVGLANVDNTSDANKPVSTLQQSALDLKANLASPTLTGTPLAPTATIGTNTTQIATTAFVTSALMNIRKDTIKAGYIMKYDTLGTIGAGGYRRLGVDSTLAHLEFVDRLNPQTVLGAKTFDNLILNNDFKFTDGNEASGKVLTSDASGNVSWQTASGGGNTVYNESFTGSTSTTLTLSHNYISGSIRLFKNGVRVTDFTQAGANTITLTIARSSTDVYIIDFNY